MEGVEILSSTQVAAKLVFNWTGTWIVAGIIIVFSIMAGFIIMLVEHDYFELIAGILGGLFVAIIIAPLLGGRVCGTPVEYETRYKVTIDDSVSMNEFLDKYEILDQEGKIYTVKERE